MYHFVFIMFISLFHVSNVKNKQTSSLFGAPKRNTSIYCWIYQLYWKQCLSRLNMTLHDYILGVHFANINDIQGNACKSFSLIKFLVLNKLHSAGGSGSQEIFGSWFCSRCSRISPFWQKLRQGNSTYKNLHSLF